MSLNAARTVKVGDATPEQDDPGHTTIVRGRHARRHRRAGRCRARQTSRCEAAAVVRRRGRDVTLHMTTVRPPSADYPMAVRAPLGPPGAGAAGCTAVRGARTGGVLGGRRHAKVRKTGRCAAPDSARGRRRGSGHCVSAASMRWYYRRLCRGRMGVGEAHDFGRFGYVGGPGSSRARSTSMLRL